MCAPGPVIDQGLLDVVGQGEDLGPLGMVEWGEGPGLPDHGGFPHADGAYSQLKPPGSGKLGNRPKSSSLKQIFLHQWAL